MYHMNIKPLSMRQKIGKFLKSYTGIMTIISLLLLIWVFLYKYLLVTIPAKWDFMPVLGEIFYAISLSVIASTIVLLITVYFPQKQKQDKIDSIVLPWLCQFVLLGDTMLRDIGGDPSISREKFQEKCSHDLMSAPANSTLGFLAQISFANWFEYFEYVFEQEERYYEKLLPYIQMLPLEVLRDFEIILKPDILRGAVFTYRQYYSSKMADVDYTNMSGFANLIWLNAIKMKEMVRTYQLYS